MEKDCCQSDGVIINTRSDGVKEMIDPGPD